MAAGLVVAEAVRVVEADKDAGGQIGGEADKPRIMPIVGGARLAGDRLADGLDDLGGAALNHALQHRHDLEGRAGIGHLLARIRDDRHRLMLPIDRASQRGRPLVGAEDRRAVAVLNAIDQGRRNSLAAIDQHRIGGGMPQQRRLAGAERHRIFPRHVVHDAEALDRLGDRLHADHRGDPHRHRVERLLERDAQRRRPAEPDCVLRKFEGVHIGMPGPCGSEIGQSSTRVDGVKPWSSAVR